MMLYISKGYSVNLIRDYVLIVEHDTNVLKELHGDDKDIFLHDLATITDKVKDDSDFEAKVDRLCHTWSRAK